MLGFDNLIKDLIHENLGMSPEELRAQAEKMIAKGQETVAIIVNNQNVIFHQNKRIIELLEKLTGEGVINPPQLGNDDAKPN